MSVTATLEPVTICPGCECCDAGACGEQSTASLTFDGTGLGAVALTPPTGTFSLSFWIKTAGTSVGILGWNGNSTATSGSRDRLAYVDAAGKLAWNVYNGSVNTQTSDTVVNDNAWHHIMTTVTSDGMDIYIDGTRQTTTFAGVVNGYNSYATPHLVLGKVDTGLGLSSFSGLLDDVALWSSDKRSSAAGITSGSVDVSTLSPTNLWRLEEGSGTTVEDSAGSADITLSGGATWSSTVPGVLA